MPSRWKVRKLTTVAWQGNLLHEATEEATNTRSGWTFPTGSSGSGEKFSLQICRAVSCQRNRRAQNPYAPTKLK